MTDNENIPPGEAQTQQDEADEPALIDRTKLYELVGILRNASDSGEVSPLLAREAADAITLLLDAGKKRPSGGEHRGATLTNSPVKSLRGCGYSTRS